MKYIYITLFCFLSSNAYSVECRKLGHKDGVTETINATIHKYTHVILPENIMEGTEPLVGNSELWTYDSAGPHVYIKPTSELRPGTETSLSVVGQSGKSYDFIVKRLKKLKNSCYAVTDGVLFTNEQRSSMKLKRNNSSGELAKLWRDKYMDAKNQNNKTVQNAIRKALRKYRYQIYTRYNWDKGGDGFIGDDLVSDVYDDGRFTYIRVFNQNKGLMMIEAELSGQVEMIEAKFDTINRMYTVAGIFPKFTLKYAESEVNISRSDNKTAGEF